MLIKRVVVQGFKTFAHKTEFIFDPGITAIVGPNGSGKSNVVDAIRWSLGEQSFSLLRSKKTSDVIFSGSEKRARLGMAQVSLTLDNSNGELPIDFSEIEITRRAYRDGDNEYLLNGQRARLGDITEMLSHTGLGKRTYAVIGQGLIDKVLSLSPEERRSLFEEAAGITAYQAKRTRTLRQLDATQQNLTRVYDITAELSPRLKYLRRQAERAREREQIANDLRGMLRTWYGYRWHTTLNQLTENQLAEARLKQSVETRQQSLTALGTKIEQLRTKQAELRQHLGELHREASHLHNRAEAVTRQLAVGQERLHQLQERREELMRELSPLSLQAQTIQERLTELVNTVAKASALYTERQSAGEALQDQLNQRQQERVTLQRNVEAARQGLLHVQKLQADSQSRLSQIVERSAVLRAERETERLRHEKAISESQEAQQGIQKAEEELSDTDQKFHALQHEIQQAEKTLTALVGQLREYEAERQAADRALDQRQTRYDLLQRLRNEGAGYASGVRAVLQLGNSHQHNAERLTGILGTVAELVRIPSNLDKAIETALGGTYQNVVTERWENAYGAINFLKQSGRGRATFLPLDRLNVLPRIEAPNHSGILGNGADLVEYDPQVEEVVLSLLGRVWVAQDLPAARQALDGIRRGPRPTVVTLAGEIVRPGGAVTGGRDSSRRDESVLSREREFRELPEQIVVAKEMAEKVASTCQTCSEKIEQGRLLIEQRQQILADIIDRRQEQVEVVAEERRVLDRVEQTIRWHAERMSQIEAEQSQLNEQEQAQQDRLEEQIQQQGEAERMLTLAEANVDASGADELLTQLADLRAAAAEAQGNLRSQQTLQNNQQLSLEEIVGQIQSKKQRAADLGEEAEALIERIAELTEQEHLLSQEIVQYQEKIDPAEAELAQLAKNQSATEKTERELQRVLRQEESTWSTAQLKLQRTEDALVQLRYDIEQDFGLVQLEQSQDIAYQPPLPLESVVEALPMVEELPEGLEDEVKEMRVRLSRVSNVNPEAPREYDEAAERYEFLKNESEDLEKAARDLRTIIKELDELMEIELSKTFTAVSEQFARFFELLFNGGTAKLVLTTPEDLNHTGIEIIARPPGKRPQSLALLSGGERALSACALIFSILYVSPTPFCVLDEVDAALDEANVDRFRQTVETLTSSTQFIIVTHNRRTLEGANTIYGITMGDDGVSKMISLRLEGDKIVQSGGERDDAQVKEVEELVQM
ncbi:chromosome segregation protein SMC [Chloroflexi bacterium TSY]|nr:chromosome segregation protein SMC [Chloroflexi bacterium TSY]